MNAWAGCAHFEKGGQGRLQGRLHGRDREDLRALREGAKLVAGEELPQAKGLRNVCLVCSRNCAKACG